MSSNGERRIRYPKAKLTNLIWELAPDRDLEVYSRVGQLGFCLFTSSITASDKTDDNGKPAWKSYDDSLQVFCGHSLSSLTASIVEHGSLLLAWRQMSHADWNVIIKVSEKPDAEKARQGENVFSFR